MKMMECEIKGGKVVDKAGEKGRNDTLTAGKSRI
jgi:hypothetical protein